MKDKRPIRNYARVEPVIDIPDLLKIQRESFDSFLQNDVPKDERLPQGLEKIFRDIFPIESNNKEYSLEYVNYELGHPKYSTQEALNKGLTYSVPLTAMLRLIIRTPLDESADSKNTEVWKVLRGIDSAVFLGELPTMTETGSFIINGAERVIVSQLHRSPGVFFEEKTMLRGPTNLSARVIPSRGSWIDIKIDANDILYANIDKRTKRIPITMLLRALGLSTDAEILAAFYPTVELDISKVLGRKSSDADDDSPESKTNIIELTLKSFADDIIDPETGELLAACDEPVESEEKVEMLAEHGITKIKFLGSRHESSDFAGIRKTLIKESSNLGAGVEKNEDSATMWIYEALRGTEAPNIDHARSYLRSMFFDSKRYNLSEVGRYKLNERLNISTSMEKLTLTVADFVSIVDNLMLLREGLNTSDDIDHLGNRRVRTVGELLGLEFSKGLGRMARTIKDKMGHTDKEKLTPHALVNSRTLSSVIKSFFGSNQLSQFMEQTNPIAELTHKRRLSALGPGGLTRERAGFDVRDVHHTHYGRICPVETPEGPNIGLITTLSMFATINRFGFLESPYRRVIDGRVTDEVVYLSADREDRMIIAEADSEIDKNGYLANDLIRTRKAATFPMVSPEKVDFIDVSPKQLVGVSASLIPFLEHDDANRALMGSNMQRQAVPLLYPHAPFIGTGMERRAARDSGALVVAERAGQVVYADSQKAVIKSDTGKSEFNIFDSYCFKNFIRTNQDTCLNQRPLVRIGDKVKRGSVIGDGISTDDGRLALGVNALVAFVPWNGYNYEDAIVVSERLIKDDIFASLHIVEEEVQFRETKLGPQELTRELPEKESNALELRHLDEDGIVKIGSRVKERDILVGRITPAGEKELSPSERLIRAIFGKKAGDIKDVSLKASTGMDGYVTDVKVFSRKDSSERTLREIDIKSDHLRESILERKNRLEKELDDVLTEALKDMKAVNIVDRNTGEQIVPAGRKITKSLLKKIDFTEIDKNQQLIEDLQKDDEIRQIMKKASTELRKLDNEQEGGLEKLQRGDDLPAGVIKTVKVTIAKRRNLQVGDKMAGRHGNKGVVSIVVPVEDMPFLPDGTPIDICLNPLGVPSRMNVGQIMETNLGMAAGKVGYDVETPVFDSATNEQIGDALKEAGLDTDGKTVLYDGKTGDAFDQRVTVGIMYMMKLNHQVDDKIHARSTGPYAMVTQQPLGGKAQNGGQRLGEMEVWALEAYGAANCLKEMLTIKSDDIDGRDRAFSAMVNNKPIPTSLIPESFNVLRNEMRSLALDVELIREEEE